MKISKEVIRQAADEHFEDCNFYDSSIYLLISKAFEDGAEWCLKYIESNENRS